jgi:hypothetical protein
MIKIISKAILTFVFVGLMSFVAMAQSNNDQKKPPPKNDKKPPPQIEIKEKRPPKKDRPKEKKPEFESNINLFFIKQD